MLAQKARAAGPRADAAHKAGRYAGWLHAIFRQRCRPTVKTLAALADVMEVPVSELWPAGVTTVLVENDSGHGAAVARCRSTDNNLAHSSTRSDNGRPEGVQMMHQILTSSLAILVGLCLLCDGHADIYRTGNSEVIPGTEGIVPGPGVVLTGLDLRWAALHRRNLARADFSQADLTSAHLYSSILTDANLSQADLSQASLASSRLTNADLTGAIVRGTSFRNTTSRGFTRAQLESTASYQTKQLQRIGLNENDLDGWDLSGQNLNNAYLFSSQLTQANLSKARLDRANLDGSNLQEANLSGARMSQASLKGADLRNADLTGAWLDDAWLTDANLENTNLTATNIAGAALRGAILSGAIVYGASFDRTGITPEQFYSTATYLSHDLQNMNLGNNDLSEWSFAGKNLSGARFRQSNLKNADFSGAILSGTSFEDADLSSAKFDGANVTYASFNFTNLTKEQLYATANYAKRDLRGIELRRIDLTDWDMNGHDLSDANLNLANLSGVDLSDALVAGTNFWRATDFGFSKEQLYSTASYQMRDLQRIQLGSTDLAGWDLDGQNLRGARFVGSTLSDTTVVGAVIDSADFGQTTSSGFTKEQLYSTASYQAGNLARIKLGGNDLANWDFSDQTLTGASFASSDLTNAKFARADLTNADFSYSDLSGTDFVDSTIRNATFLENSEFRLAKEQLYSTRSYKEKNLSGIKLSGVDLSGADLTEQDLSDTRLWHVPLTEVDLTGAKLVNSAILTTELTGANFVNANLKNTYLGYENELADADQADFRGAVYNQWTVLPAGFDAEAAGMTFVQTAEGDFDADGDLDLADLALLTRILHYRGCDMPPGWLVSTCGFRRTFFLDGMFDLDDRDSIGMLDVDFWVRNLKRTWYGDVDLDGEFTSDDLVSVLAAGQYEGNLPGNSTWSTGDWNSDGFFTSADLILALADGGYEAGPRPAAVPEPSGTLFLLMGLICFSLPRLGTRSNPTSNTRKSMFNKSISVLVVIVVMPNYASAVPLTPGTPNDSDALVLDYNPSTGELNILSPPGEILVLEITSFTRAFEPAGAIPGVFVPPSEITASTIRVFSPPDDLFSFGKVYSAGMGGDAVIADLDVFGLFEDGTAFQDALGGGPYLCVCSPEPATAGQFIIGCLGILAARRLPIPLPVPRQYPA